MRYLRILDPSDVLPPPTVALSPWMMSFASRGASGCQRQNSPRQEPSHCPHPAQSAGKPLVRINAGAGSSAYGSRRVPSPLPETARWRQHPEATPRLREPWAGISGSWKSPVPRPPCLVASRNPAQRSFAFLAMEIDRDGERREEIIV